MCLLTHWKQALIYSSHQYPVRIVTAEVTCFCTAEDTATSALAKHMLAVTFCCNAAVCASTSQGPALGGTALAMWLLSPNWVCRADPSWSGASL